MTTPGTQAARYLVLITLVTITHQNVVILSTPYGDTHPAPCAFTCTGVSRHDEQGIYAWKQDTFRGRNRAVKVVNFRECGFAGAPVVTATSKGVKHSGSCLPVSLDIAGNVGFSVYMEDASVRDVVGSYCDVYWSANGYNC